MDKISELSDDVLIKILSLIPTKDAVAMSAVSKRWMSLWTLVPRLEFDDYSEEDKDAETNENHHDRSLSKLVSGTLLLHKAVVLESFHLNSVSVCSASEIGLWVRIVVDRFVRDLKISFDVHGIVKLPSRLFRCETIETLELDKVIVFEVPCRFSFRSLKKLSLLSVEYPDEESFSRLISNCPILEDLVVETCEKDNVVTYIVNLASLQSLSIVDDYVTASMDEFVIHCHSLKQLKINSYCGELNLIGNLSKLVKANIVQSSSHQSKVLESFTFVKHLSLCLDEKAQYPTGTFLFQLLRLELCCCEDNWTSILVSVLQHSPKLQVLKLCMNKNHYLKKVGEVCWIQPERVPECMLFHLKTFEWREYEGTVVENDVAVYILKNVSRLATATIFYPDSVNLVDKLIMFQELETATRSSRACELTLG